MKFQLCNNNIKTHELQKKTKKNNTIGQYINIKTTFLLAQVTSHHLHQINYQFFIKAVVKIKFQKA